MKTHRLAKIPPCGLPSSGRRQALCGTYVRREASTTDPELVDCQTCRAAETSARTIARKRLVDVEPFS